MTAITADRLTADSGPGPLQRITRVVKLHLANPWPVLITPSLILAFIFLVNYAIWALITVAAGPATGEKAAEGFQYSGASFFIFVYMLVVAVMAMNQSFAYALGFSSTRRDYYLGTALTFVLLAAIYTVGITALGAIERATNGWGLNGRMFSAIYFGDGPLVQAFCVFCGFLFFFFVGAATGSMYVRWKQYGIIGFFAVLALVLVGLTALITFTGSWGRVGEFFATAGFVGSYAWSLVLTGIAAIAGYLLLRKATPRSS